MDKRFLAFNFSCFALSKEVQKNWNLKTFNQGYGMTSLTLILDSCSQLCCQKEWTFVLYSLAKFHNEICNAFRVMLK